MKKTSIFISFLKEKKKKTHRKKIFFHEKYKTQIGGAVKKPATKNNGLSPAKLS